VAESGRWICERCRSERLRLLEEKLQNALLQIEDLTWRDKALDDQLRLASAGREVGRRYTVSGHQEDVKCLVLGEAVIRNVGTDNSDMMVECFPGIRTEQLHRVIDNRKLGSPDAETDDLRKTRNLDYVMGEVYGLVETAKTKFPTPKIVLSGVLRRRDVSWRRIEATFVDPNRWVSDWDFARDGLHINRRGARELGQLYSRVCGISGGGKKMRSE
jgi:hypothetical protein